jgi:ribosomal protein S18 acetylase RimI-like enzyme
MLYAIHAGKQQDLAPIGLWEAEGRLVGMVNSETVLGEAHFQVRDDYPNLVPDMLDFAVRALCVSDGRRRRLTLYVSACNGALEQLAEKSGFAKAADSPQHTLELGICDGLGSPALPEGFRLTDRAKSNDLVSINRVLWRGFNHAGPPPDENVACRADVEKAPLYRPELVVMVEAPDKTLVSYCGVWYVPANRLAYVEPVATDPDYRRRGLGRAAVLEAIRRSEALGATRAIVGSGLEFYRAIGFQQTAVAFPWHKEWQV